MTSPGSGFKIAEAFVEVTTKDNTRSGQDRIKAALSRIRGTATVDADTSRASRKIAALTGETRRFTGGRHRAKVEVDTSAAEQRLRRLIQLGGGLGAIGGGALKSVAGLAALASAAGTAGAALAALPALGAAVGGIGGVLVGAFSGVGDALKGYKADQEAATAAAGKGASAAADNSRAIQAAASAIDDARRNQARVAQTTANQITDAQERVQDALDDVRDAEEAVADARRDAARVAEQAAESVAQASERVQDAQRDETRAQADLNDERARALRQMEELAERVSDLALDQEGAAIRLIEAQAELDEVMGDSSSTDLDKRKALLALAQAQDRVSDLEREAAEAAKENAKAQEVGVEGAQNVIDARERLEEANRRTNEAEAELAKTQRRAAEDQAEASRRVQDALEGVSEAQAGVARAERELARTRQEAAWAQEDAAEAVSDAMQSLADAQASTAESATGGAAAASKYADAMAKLTPEARAFVGQLLRMEPLVKGLRNTAQRTFLPGLTQMLRDSEGLFPIFNGHIERTGQIMANTARSMGQLFKSDEFKSNLDTLFKASQPITQAIGDGLVTLTGRLVKFGAEMAPAAQGFAGFIDKTVNGLSGFMDALAPHADSFKRIWESLGRIMETLLPVIGDVIGQLADHLAPALENLAGFLERNKDSLDEWMLALGGFLAVLKGAKVVGEVASWTSRVISLVDGIGRSADKNRSKFSKLKDLLKGGLVIGAITGGAELISGLTQNPNDPNAAWRGLDQDKSSDLSGGERWNAVKSFDLQGIGSGMRKDLEDQNFNPLAGFDGDSVIGKFVGDLTAGWDAAIGRFFTETVPGWFSSLWETVSAGWSGFTGQISGLWTGTKDAFGAAWDWIGQKFQWVNDNIIQPVGLGIQTAGQWIADKYTWVKDTLGAAWDWVGAKFTWLNVNVVQPVGLAIQTAGQWIADKFVWVRNMLGSAWDWVAGKFQWLNASVIQPVGGAIRNAAQWIGDKFEWLRGLAGNAWDWIGNRINWVKDNIVGPIFGGLRAGIDGIGRAFENVKDWIGRAWGQIQELARRPVQFVVDTVYNNGIRRVWNGIASTFGMGQLGEVRFASGGIMPGYTPGRDVHLAALSGGEAVMRPEWTRAAGESYINGANRAARIGGVQGAAGFIEKNGLPGYADGGIVGGLKSFWDGLWSSPVNAIKSLFSSVLGDGGNTPGTGALREALTRLPGKAIDGIITKVKNWLTSGGGGKGIGAAISFAKAQAGKPYIWAGVGPNGYDCSGFMSALTNVIRGRNPYSRVGATSSFPWAGFRPGVASAFTIGSSPNTGDGIGHMAGTLAGMNVESRGGDGVVVGGRARGASDRLFNTRAGLAFDQGGIARGYGYLPKSTPKPERVLSPEQTGLFERMVTALESGSRGEVHVHVTQNSGSPAETGRAVALALRTVG
ncbi:hypothetical protein ACFQH9_02155 [Pseudonocardia lutea]|uniref:Phage-related protein n=1 Tax=Pseudonocardia lutea TaxID=2172015 RepID=A0ABW1I135_9PSEU